LFRIFRLHIVTKNNTPLSLFKFHFHHQTPYSTPQPIRKSRPNRPTFRARNLQHAKWPSPQRYSQFTARKIANHAVSVAYTSSCRSVAPPPPAQ
jgi:hypothetical protein